MKNSIFSSKKAWVVLGISVILVATLVGVTLQLTSTPRSEEMAGVDTTATTDITSDQPATSTPDSGSPTSLTILSITGGDVFVKRVGTSDWVAAQPGITLQSGDAVKTGGNSNAEITFFEGSTIELDGSTEIAVSELGISDTGSTTINLKQEIGKTVSRVTKLTDQESTYEIETPAAVAAVRGSTMVVTVLEDGTTIVANLGGDIRVIAQGVEVIIPVGMQVTVVPGHPPGVPVPINPPTTTTTIPPTTTTTTTTSGGGGSGGGETVYVSSINTGVQADSTEVYIGDTITYTYLITNTGNLQIQSVSISDDVTGVPAYQSGDTNTNSRLDPGETWIYTAEHIASSDDPSPLINNATFTATVSESNVLISQEGTEVNILPTIRPLSITTGSLSDGEAGAEYSQKLSAIGGTSPYTWSLVAGSGTLPDGLGLDSATGNITGTPTTAGIPNFTIRVTDSIGSIATKALSISVKEALTIDTEYLPDGNVGMGYSQTLVATNGITPYTWSIIRGGLPDGLVLDSATGSITGTPTIAGTFSFTIRVTDGLGVTVTKHITITVSN